MPTDFTLCRVCKKPLREGLANYAKRQFQTMICGKKACVRTDDIQSGKLCCDQAQYINCVCHRAYSCPTHGDTHIGSHD